MAQRVRPLLLLPLLLPLGAAAGGRDLTQDPDMISSENMVDEMLVKLGERDKRLTVPVVVGNRGPYNFIIDTGAERTVVSRELAGTLGLNPGKPVTLTSMTGRSLVNTVVVPDLSIKSIGMLHTVIAPSLGARDLGAAGLLGIDTLSKHAVSIDFEKGTMVVRPSVKKDRDRARSDEIIVTAKTVFGQLIVTDAYYGNSRVQVVLDTGSQVTMGNMALRKRIGRSRMKAAVPIQLTSVTGGKLEADYTTVPDIRIGRLTFGEMPIAFADLAPFHRFGLTKRPALLLGMDALRAFRRVDIDFPNRQVRFVMHKIRDKPAMFMPTQIGGYPTRSE